MNGHSDGGEWPVELRGVTESIVTTRGPNDRYNVAALGVHAGDPATARTWGQTRTRQNVEARGQGYVQFAPDPVAFAEAALTVREEPEPILETADAWAEVEFRRRDSGTEGETEWVDWALRPVDSRVERRGVRTTNRGYYAVIEATVAASRLGVEAYDQQRLRQRLDYFEGVVETCGGSSEQAAFEIVRANADW